LFAEASAQEDLSAEASAQEDGVENHYPVIPGLIRNLKSEMLK